MASGKHKLTERKIKSVKGPARLSDGHGLYLVVRRSGSKSWSYVWIKHGKRREMGLGGLAGVSLAQARKRAENVRNQIAEGLDPFLERDGNAPKSFGEVADLLLAELEHSWTNKKNGQQWARSLNVHCAKIRATPIKAIETAHVLDVIKPVWAATPETGRRLRARIEKVLDYARSRDWRDGENPARWKGHLQNLLSNNKPITPKHFPAMPYENVPAFIVQLNDTDTMATRALEFTILTAARSGEVLKAVWNEIDFDATLWTIPAERMKARKEHRVPLSPRAIAILKPLYETRVSEFVFPSTRPKKSLSDMAMTMAMRRMGFGHYVPHGFRSAFRDFAGNETVVAREVAEAALAHSVGNAVEAAYRRGDALEKRRGLMKLWADYCAGIHSGEIVRLHG